ncbi:hypothetical protein Lmor_2516 [Legionella moravica]|uniref:Uncharacterized protein n=1 Tax=Legionella moravica TaxID=39962 RepID=A0A378JW69_9GAMM|nr:hypothetical protein [Legionella moravica]KTD31640.1 hypothetical protein Lmor_2516 [Legionella moravica]STX62280.1 Uncharacterised protein [Legionella moravica]
MPIKDSFKGGLNLNFLPSSEFESLENNDKQQRSGIIGRNVLRLLMMGWPKSWTELITWHTLSAVFIEHDHALLKEFRAAFQQGFENIYAQLKGRTLDAKQSEQVQLYLSNCLCHLPYSDLTPFESIKIPQCVNGEWELVEYSVNPIELTDDNQYTVRKTDRVFAYGIEPIINKNAESHLIFMGTNYPTGQGFLPQIVTDFEAFETVGSSLYLSGRQRIKDWLSRQKDKVHVCGASLGGSLGLLLAVDLGEHLSRVDALNPAGLHHLEPKSKYDQWEKLTSKPPVIIQQQGDDPVSLLGLWKSDWEILHVSPPPEKKGPNPFCDHFMNYAGFADTVFTYMDPEQQNAKRKTRNLLFYSIGRSVVYYLMISPYTHILRPAWYYTKDAIKSASLIFLAVLAGAGVLIGLAITGILPPLLFIGATAVFAILSSLFLIPAVMNAILSNQTSLAQDTDNQINYAQIHDPALPRNPEMDLYNKEHQIEVNLTYKELHAYYKAMRVLVKQKDFIPADDLKMIKGTEVSKRQCLMDSQKPENEERVVTLKTTKAKAVQIKHTLTFIDQLGFENDKELKKALDLEYRHYTQGKINSI